MSRDLSFASTKRVAQLLKEADAKDARIRELETCLQDLVDWIGWPDTTSTIVDNAIKVLHPKEAAR